MRQAPGVGGKFLEMDPAFVEVPAQVILYTAEDPQVLEGSAVSDVGGQTVINVTVPKAPSQGTPIQVVVYPDPDVAPYVIEGVTTGDGRDGTIGIRIDIPDDLVP